jgi:hypothetical protein
MQRALVVRGRLKDGKTIVLDEPVEGVEVEVEVVLRELAPPPLEETGESVIAVLRREDLETAMRGELGVEVVHAPLRNEDFTESPVVLARRVSATVPAGPPSADDTPPSGV